LSMKIIDLSRKISGRIERSFVPLRVKGKGYRGVIYQIGFSSMAGSYIDFPGHIAEFDNGLDAASYPPEKLFLVETTVIRLNRKGLPREIKVAELEKFGPVSTPGLLVDTGWKKDVYHPEVYFYGEEAIAWIVSQKIRLFLSDVYENHARPRGVFVELFRAGISTVCLPDNLDKITRPRVKICVFPLPVAGLTQAPCRVLAVED